jgi:O-succinylbenzoic acid--CoA ligase
MCVELTFENIYCSSINWSKIYKFTRKDIYLNILPLFHVSGLSIFYRSLYSNFFLVYKNYNKNSLHKEIIKSAATCLSLVPKMFNDVVKKNEGSRALQSLQFIILGGDAITYDIFKKCSEYNIKIYASYGLTESSSGIAGFWINQEKEYLQGFIGHPHFNTKVFIKNGNIGIQSKTIMKKYSSGNDTQGIYISSDKGKMVGDKICFIGRNKDFIVSGGENINIKNIEDLLKKLAFDKEVILISRKDDKWGEVPIVIYESKEESLDFINEMLYCCKKKLPKYMVPKHFISIKKIPRYDNLKVDYFKLNQYVRENFK